MKRKIIQLEETASCTLALCDDGTVFKLTRVDNRPLAYEYAWEELPPLPEKQIERNFIGSNQVSEGEVSPAFAKGIRDAKTHGPEYCCPYHHTNEQICREWRLGFQTVYPNAFSHL